MEAQSHNLTNIIRKVSRGFNFFGTKKKNSFHQVDTE